MMVGGGGHNEVQGVPLENVLMLKSSALCHNLSVDEAFISFDQVKVGILNCKSTPLHVKMLRE